MAPMDRGKSSEAADEAQGEARWYLARPWLAHYPAGTAPTIEVPRRTVTDFFAEAVGRWKNKTAIIFYGRKISYRQLGEQVSRMAAALHGIGVRAGDRVGLYLLNSPQFIIAYFAILRLGAVVSPISPVYSAKEARHQLLDSGARVAICQDLLLENVLATDVELEHIIVANVEAYVPLTYRLFGQGILRRGSSGGRRPATGRKIVQFEDLLRRPAGGEPPRPEIDPARDLAALPYTGGTTGPAKGAMLTHRNLISVLVAVRDFWTHLEEGKEVIVAFLPFYHIYGQVAIMLSGLVQGSTLLLYTTPDMDAILYGMEKCQATAFFGVPTLYEFLREYEKTARVNWKRLKLLVCGADTLHQSTIRGWEEKTGAMIYEGYGMTETSAVSHVNPLGRRKVGSFGVPLANATAAIMDPDRDEFRPPGEIGELVISGPHIMAGYWNNPEETRRVLVEAAGLTWLRTGDLARMDEEGYFFFYDRKRDLIKYKGYSVFAREIEEVLKQHPQVKEAGVVGVPDPQVGQYVKAYVVPYSEARGTLSEEDLAAHCRQHLAPYKVPRQFELRGELPRTDVGKVSRRELRDELAEEI